MNNSRHRFLISLLTAVTALASVEAAQGASAAVPRLVVNILVDQLRSDYLEAFAPLYGDDGFKRLLSEGRVFRQPDYEMARVDRASAAATIASGAAPLYHGIVGNRWLNRATLRPMSCVDDPKTHGQAVGLGGSPARLGVSTVPDELKVATDGQAYVYAIAPYRDAAILTAGHAADGAFWIDDATGFWCTTDYYGSLPSWVNRRDLYHPVDSVVKDGAWTPLSDAVTQYRYFLSPKNGKEFKRKFNGNYRYHLFKHSALVNEEVAGMVSDCLDNVPLGQDDVPDYLAVTLYAGPYDHLTPAQAPVEWQDTYARLDRVLARVINTVEKKVGGSGQVLFVLTSTGYADEMPDDVEKYRIPTGTFDMKRSTALLDLYLQAIYGKGKYVEASWGEQIFLNKKLLEERQLDLTEVLQRTEDFLLQLSGVDEVYTTSRVLQGAEAGVRRIRNSFHKESSGDVWISVAPGWHLVNSETHEHQLVRAAHVPFPIIFFGAGTTPARIETPVTPRRIAPTLSRAMRIRAPSASTEASLPLD